MPGKKGTVPPSISKQKLVKLREHLSLSLSLSLELYILFSLSQKYQKCWIALQRARADPRDPYNPPLMWGSWTPWKGCPVFILRRWKDISKFSFLDPEIRIRSDVSPMSHLRLADVSRNSRILEENTKKMVKSRRKYDENGAITTTIE